MDVYAWLEPYLIPWGDAGTIISQVIMYAFYAFLLGLIIFSIYKVMANAGKMSDADIDPAQKKQYLKGIGWALFWPILAISALFGIILFVGYLVSEFSGGLSSESVDLQAMTGLNMGMSKTIYLDFLI